MRLLLSIKLAASAYTLLTTPPLGLRTEPFATYLTKPVGSNEALKNSSVPCSGSNFTYSLSSDLAPSLYPVIVAAGRDNGSAISSLPRNNLV